MAPFDGARVGLDTGGFQALYFLQAVFFEVGIFSHHSFSLHKKNPAQLCLRGA
jgi:hypothetical protein